MESSSPTQPPGPGLRDLMGFMVGFAVAASLFRRLRPGDSSVLVEWAGFAVAFVWFGLAASGPFVAWLFRIGDPGQLPNRNPERLGQLIGSVPVASASGVRRPGPTPRRVRKKTRNVEGLWIALGSFSIFFGMLGRDSVDQTSFATYLSIQMSWMCLMLGCYLLFLERPDVPRWTDRLAWLILLTWPFAVGGLWLIGHG